MIITSHSHLPHAIAFSLASGILKEEDKKRAHVALGGPTFAATTRVAKSSPLRGATSLSKITVVTSDKYVRKEPLMQRP